MRPHDIRSDRAKDVAAEFFDKLVSGDVESARVMTADGFTWFKNESPDWGRLSLKTETTVSGVRDVEPAIMALVAPAEPLGPLLEADRVVLVDVTRAGRTVTAAAIVRKGRIIKVSDATPLRRAIEDLNP